MARRTLKASVTGIERAKRALKRKGWTQKDLTIEPLIASWGTINNFFNGRAIDHNIFREICFHLELDWQDIYEPELEAEPEPEAQVEPVKPSHPPDAPPPQDDLLAAVQRCAIAAREALTPRILERIPREVVGHKYLPAIDRGVNGGQMRVIPLIGAAGYGKSTILGDLYDQLTQAATPWVGLILCSTLSLSVEVRSFISYSAVAATWGNPTNAATPSDYQAAMIEMGLGKSLCGTSRSVLEVAAHLNHTHGRGVLLIDTLDLVVNRDFTPVFASLLRQLLEQGTTVVFTCRDQEYNDYLEPTRERLISLAECIDRHTVPNFTTAEIRAAAIAFFHQREPDATERGHSFADNILALSADQRSLQDIIQNPLLLAILCDLFAAEGNVPADLTVSKLYQRYWQEKIAYSRFDQSNAALLAMEKENLCLTLARVLFELSHERLCESIYRDELGLQFTPSLVAAYSDLLSEGVLEQLPSRKLHFFHQTLLEYAIAYWLTRQTAQAQCHELFTRLNQSTGGTTHWLPVLRQLLTIVEPEAAFEQLLTQLDLNNLGLFGVVAVAAASRDRPEALRQLLPTALERGEAYQRRLRQAFSGAARPLVATTWDLLLTLLEQAEHATAGNTAQLAGELLARWWPTLQWRLPETLAAIGRRSLAVAGPDYQVQGDRALLLGWLLQPCLPWLQQNPEPALLSALQQQRQCLGYRTWAAVIQLHNHPNVSPGLQRSLLQPLLLEPVPDHDAVKTALWNFIARQLPSQLASSDFPLGHTWPEVLYRPLPEGWSLIQAKAVGQWAARDTVVLAAVVHEFLTDQTAHVRQNLIALTESLDHGAGLQVLQNLQRTEVEILNVLAFSRIAPLLMRLAKVLAPPEQELLAIWLQPYARDQIEALYPALDALADAAPTAYAALIEALPALSPAKQRQVRHQLLRFQPIPTHPPLTTLDKASQKYLITVYRQQAATNGLARDRLLAIAQGQSKEVALMASVDLAQVWDAQPQQLLPLLQSIFPGVRAHALTAIGQRLDREPPLTPELLTQICQVLQTEANQTVIRLLCNLIAQWVKQYQCVLPILLPCLIELPPRLLKSQLFEGGVARALLDALKAIAQSADQSGDAVVLGQAVRLLLGAIHMIQVRNSESELIDLLSAMQRRDRQFLATVIHVDCPSLAQQGWTRNIFAVIKTICRIEGHRSPLLDEILTLDWCNAEISSVILAVRGG